MVRGHVTKRYFACYCDRAKNKIKIESSILFSTFTSAIIICQSITLLFDI